MLLICERTSTAPIVNSATWQGGIGVFKRVQMPAGSPSRVKLQVFFGGLATGEAQHPPARPRPNATRTPLGYRGPVYPSGSSHPERSRSTGQKEHAASEPPGTFNAVTSIQYPQIRLRNPETVRIAELSMPPYCPYQVGTCGQSNELANHLSRPKYGRQRALLR